MKISLLSIMFVTVCAVAGCSPNAEREPRTQPIPPGTSAGGSQLLAGQPVAFVPNLGQWDHAAHFVARFGSMSVFFEDEGWTISLVERAVNSDEGTQNDGLDESDSMRGVAVRMSFVGASAPELIAEDRLPGRHNYFLGSDPSKWRSDVPIYRAVRYRGVRPGVDVRGHERDGHFEYDMMLRPGADLRAVEIAVEGSEGMWLDGDGDLVMETTLGPLRMPAPTSWEETPGSETTPIACHYALRGQGRFGFEVTERRPNQSLVIDPGLIWSTFLGGTVGDGAYAVALDPQGSATVAGLTYSDDFPTTPGAFATSRTGSADAVVTRLSPTGSSLVFSTFVGGTGPDLAAALDLDAQGGTVLTGHTLSSDFPTTIGAFDTTRNGSNDAFVTRLTPTGANLVYSTYLGGTSRDGAGSVVLDAQNQVTVAGATSSSGFPTTPGAFDTSHNGSSDVFVTRLSPTGSSLIFSTFLGGSFDDSASEIAIDSQGATAIAGATRSAGFPTTAGGFSTVFSGGSDAFVAWLSPSGSSLAYSTFLGGTADEYASALAIDARGSATIAGWTDSADFPTTPGAFDTTYGGGGAADGDAFVVRVSPTGSSLYYSTFLGGTQGGDAARALVLDARGAAIVVGVTYSTDFPTSVGAFDTSHNGGTTVSPSDAFLSRLSPTGSHLIYSTFLGGTNRDEAYAVALDAREMATVVGATASTDFPTTPGAFDTSYNGTPSYLVEDTFVTRLDMLPTGMSVLGNSSPGCTGLLAISVSSMPQVGNLGFALACGNAAPNANGMIAFAGAGYQSPRIVLGVELWLDPSGLFVTASVSSDSIGSSEAPLPIPNSPTLAGIRLFAQFFWPGPGSPPPCPPQGLSASNALEITIQP